MWSFKILIIILGIVLTSNIAYPQSYFGQYDISLIDVERPAKAKQIYGEQKIGKSQEKGIYKHDFEDEMVKIIWLLDFYAVSLAIYNKTSYSIKILWDEACFVDVNGKSSRIVHTGVKYIDKNKPQVPTIIPRKGIKEDSIFPVDNIIDSPGLPIVKLRLLPYPDPQGRTSEDIGSIFKLIKNNYVGKSFQILLPFEIEGVVNNYIFIFRINNFSEIDKGRITPISKKEWLVMDSFLWVKRGKTNKQDIISKYGKPAFQDEDSIIYKSDQHSDFKDFKSLKFIVDNAGIVTQIRGEK